MSLPSGPDLSWLCTEVHPAVGSDAGMYPFQIERWSPKHPQDTVCYVYKCPAFELITSTSIQHPTSPQTTCNNTRNQVRATDRTESRRGGGYAASQERSAHDAATRVLTTPAHVCSTPVYVCRSIVCMLFMCSQHLLAATEAV